MRSALYGLPLLALTFSLPALADCADEIAMVEQDLESAAAPATDAAAASPSKDQTAAAADSEGHAAQSPEEVVDEMVEEGVEVEEQGAETKFAAGGHAEPRETWQSGENSPEEHPAVVHLTSAKEHLEGGDEQACLDALGKARDALANEQDG